MGNSLQVRLTESQVGEFSAILGAAPVLSTEDATYYNKIWDDLIECFKPRDFLELLLIRQVQNETWKMLRFTRHQTVAIERYFRDSMKFQLKRARELKVRKEAAAEEVAERAAQSFSQLSPLLDLEDTVVGMVGDGDRILERTPSEIDHNRALEAGIGFQERLDKLISSTLARRNDALRMLEVYRDGLGDHWRQISDDFIDIAASKTEELERKMNALPLIPVPEDDDEMTEGSAIPADAAGSDTKDDDLD
jgi:hypothetical protein